MLTEEQLHYFCEAEARLAGVCVRIYEDREGKELAGIYGNHTVVRNMSTIPSDKVEFEGKARSGLRTSSSSFWDALFPNTMNGRSSSGPCAWAN